MKVMVVMMAVMVPGDDSNGSVMKVIVAVMVTVVTIVCDWL